MTNELAKSDLKLNLNELNPDRFGGLSRIGQLAVETSMLISIIVLIFPVLLNIGLTGYDPSILIITWGALGLILILFVLTYLIPSYHIYTIAKREKNVLLKEAGTYYKNELDAYEQDINEGHATQAQLANAAIFVNVQMERFRDIEMMKVFPFSRTILSKFMIGILIPIFFMVLQDFII